MVIKNMSEEVYTSLEAIRNTRIDDLIEMPLLAKPTNTISEIIGLLKENNAYQVFIVYKDKVISINIRDILEYKNIHIAKPSLVGKTIPVLNKGNTIAYCVGLMSHYRVRALPVVEDNKVIGQINSNNIIKLLYGIELNLKASSIMTPNPITLRGEDKGATAKNLIIKHKIDHIPIVDDKKPYGVLTSSHLMEILIPPERIAMMTPKQKGLTRNLSFAVKGIADKNIVTADTDSSIKYITNIISNNNSSYALITLSEEIQGIITLRDIISLLQDMVKDEIPAYIVGLPEDPIEAELAKSKFMGVLKLLKKVNPNILEARCVIKIKDIKGERRRYEVDMHIITPKERIPYVVSGWDLANVFDDISNALKRHLDKSDYKDKNKKSIRRANEYEYR